MPEATSGHRADTVRRRLAAVGVAAAVAATAAAGCDWIGSARSSGAGSAGASPASGASTADLPPGALQVVATGLDTPWEVRFLPGGGLLVTERPGSLVHLAPDPSGADSLPYAVLHRRPVPDVREAGEAGLMGLALHPGYPSPPWIYVCHTTQADGRLMNRVVRFRYRDGRLSGGETVLSHMAGAPVHDGCRLEFGPHGHLFVSMGDAGSPSRAQDRGSPNGKILRVTDRGGTPPDNPFGSPVWSLGHRNPQGLAFDPRGRLWATEHGPSGFPGGRDEVNLVRRGADYGWPEIRGDEAREGMVSPVLHSGSDTWAPAGAAWARGRLFFGGLRGEALYEVRGLGSGVGGADDGDADDDGGAAGDGDAAADDPGTDGGAVPGGQPRLVAHFRGELGRIRPVRAGPDGFLYLGTSNRDGRGRPREGDDRILRLDPEALAPDAP